MKVEDVSPKKNVKELMLVLKVITVGCCFFFTFPITNNIKKERRKCEIK